MRARTTILQRAIIGIASALLIGALFLPWASISGLTRNGWQFNTVAAVYVLVGGIFGIATAITGGQYGAGRPDVSLIGATDAYNLVSIVLLVVVIVDFPDSSRPQVGVYAALVFVAIIAFSAADYGPLRGAPWFAPIEARPPRSGTDEHSGARTAE